MGYRIERNYQPKTAYPKMHKMSPKTQVDDTLNTTPDANPPHPREHPSPNRHRPRVPRARDGAQHPTAATPSTPHSPYVQRRTRTQRTSRDHPPRRRLGVLIRRQPAAQIAVRGRGGLRVRRTRRRGRVVGGQEVEAVGGEVGFEGLLGAVDGELDGESWAGGMG